MAVLEVPVKYKEYKYIRMKSFFGLVPSIQVAVKTPSDYTKKAKSARRDNSQKIDLTSERIV